MLGCWGQPQLGKQCPPLRRELCRKARPLALMMFWPALLMYTMPVATATPVGLNSRAGSAVHDKASKGSISHREAGRLCQAGAERGRLGGARQHKGASKINEAAEATAFVPKAGCTRGSTATRHRAPDRRPERCMLPPTARRAAHKPAPDALYSSNRSPLLLSLRTRLQGAQRPAKALRPGGCAAAAATTSCCWLVRAARPSCGGAGKPDLEAAS